jgi:hypothetical protein
MYIINLCAIDSMHALRNRQEYFRQIEHRYAVRDEARRARRDRRERVWRLFRPRPSGVVAAEMGDPVDCLSSCIICSRGPSDLDTLHRAPVAGPSNGPATGAHRRGPCGESSTTSIASRTTATPRRVVDRLRR